MPNIKPLIPNQETIDAMKEAEKSEELESFDGVDELMKDFLAE